MRLIYGEPLDGCLAFTLVSFLHWIFPYNIGKTVQSKQNRFSSIIGRFNILVNTIRISYASTYGGACRSFHPAQAAFVEEQGQTLLDEDWQAPTSKFQVEYSKIKFNAGLALDAINQSRGK